MRHDTIIIGAGHNGLAAAATLAKSGQSVLVLEKSSVPGGAATNGEIAPGVTVPRMAHLLYGLGRPEIDALQLKQCGLDFAAVAIPTVSLSDDGRHVVIDGNDARFADGTPHPDSAAFAALRQRMIRYADKLSTLMRKPPPKLTDADWRQAASLASFAFGVRRMGETDMREFLRVVLSNAYDTILDEIEDGPLAGAFGVDSVLGGQVGPRAPGTILTLMYRHVAGGTKSLPKGGMGAVARAFEKAAITAGASVRYDAAVSELVIENDAVRGVRLADGTEIAAPRVISSLDPKSTMLLAGVGHFDAEMLRRVRNIRAKGCTAKLNLALSRPPEFSGLDDRLHGGRLVYAPSIATLERSFNPAKYGELPTDPILEITIPTVSDRSLAPDGTHVLSVVIQYVPYALKQGWSDEARQNLTDTVVATLNRFAPGIADNIIAGDLLTPVDIERLTGAPGGHWHHGEMTADQMLMLRPSPGIDRYALPISGLFLCGASTHPGGDVTGVPGRNAAQAILSAQPRRAAA